MAAQVYRVNRTSEYRKAGPTDLVELLPAPGNNPLFLLKWLVDTLVYAIVRHEFVHLSGPTGSAKSSLLEALYMVPDNFQSLCGSLGFPVKPLKLYAVEMAIYEAPGELYQRRSLKDGTTYDEMSKLVLALEDAAKRKNDCYPLIWLREMGRVHSSSVQGGLLNLMTRSDILLPDGRRIDGTGIAWVADSNYQAEQDCNHTLVNLDDALKRRFSINLTLDYLSGEQEVQVLESLVVEMKLGTLDRDLIAKVVKLGQAIRRQRLDGNLQSLAPPTIYGYLAFLRMAQSLAYLSLQQVAMATLLGNAGFEDRKLVFTVLNEVFGLQNTQEEDPTGGNLF
ncbi:hypothetical protein L0222_13140 [bacterium]|nr:hypothetical protein [bacterium]MCI0604935.1 hypothetical protein [bacterium]